MEKKWTAAQLAAINKQNKTLLVSAAAGSGKTATLPERIIRSITDKDSPADISKMLIVTFTRASAGDLKNKILSCSNRFCSVNTGFICHIFPLFKKKARSGKLTAPG